MSRLRARRGLVVLDRADDAEPGVGQSLCRATRSRKQIHRSEFGGLDNRSAHLAKHVVKLALAQSDTDSN